MPAKTEKKGLSDSATAVLLVLPALAVFFSIILYPFINSLAMSLTDKSLIFPQTQFTGLKNFTKLFSDVNFPGVLKNTLVFVFFSTLCPFVLGFIWALVLNQKFRAAEFLRGVTLVNWIIPGTAIGFLWMWIFHGEYGVFNAMLKGLGIIDQNINWLGQKNTAMPVVVIARTWQMLPWYMAFLLGGLQGVSFDQIEAARIDGASNWQVFVKIIVPEIKSVAGIVLILGTIGNLQHFDLLWVMTGGGPARATTTLSIEVYRSAFQNFDMGFAAAIGVVWAVLLGLFSFVYLRNLKEE